MCTCSRLIYHPNSFYHIVNGGQAVLNGYFISMSEMYIKNLTQLALDSYSGCSHSESIHRFLDNSYILRDGTRFPFLLELKCSRCAECRYEYKKEIENRALVEAANSGHVFFFTLSYDDFHLPLDGLHREHVSAAFKLLRTHIERYLDFDCHFTTVYVGEYGTDPRYTLRPHYHGLIFIKETLDSRQLLQFLDFFKPRYQSVPYEFRHNPCPYKKNFELSDCSDFYSVQYPYLQHWWPHGIRFDIVQPDSIVGSVKYICKYITKQYLEDFESFAIAREKFESHYNPCFVQLPKKIGLGCAYIDKYKDYIINSTQGTFEINCHGKVMRISIPKVFIAKLFPTLGRYCPNMTYNYKVLCTIYQLLKSINLEFNSTDYATTSYFKRYIDYFDYLKYFSLRRRQERHLQIAKAYYSKCTYCELIAIFKEVLDMMDFSFDDIAYNQLIYEKVQFYNHKEISRLPFEERQRYLDRKVYSDRNSSNKLRFSYFDSIR